MLDKTASSLAKYNSDVRAIDSPLDVGSSNWNYLKRTSFPETSASTLNQSMPIISLLDVEALSSLSNSPCPAAIVGCLEDFLPSMIGYSLPNTQGEQAKISNKVESEEIAEPPSKYCSNVAQQSEASMGTKMTRAPKVLSSRIYRAKVAEAIKALKNALPFSEMGNQASILDNVIDYIKFLKLRLNVLSQTRLTGEASAHSFVHIEGFGHYLLHPQTYHQPLEEMVGNLLKSNPQVANELLEHKGLAIVPMDSAYTALQNSLNPCSNSCQ
ncbi:transcription factor bHLH66-like isoform X2 [Phalaenopsis equestris]|nr:transcription factor bHLH66-like isoform X2 [Phalaenopsis equestris]